MAKKPTKNTSGTTTHRMEKGLPRQIDNAKGVLSGASRRAQINAAEMAAVKPKAKAKPAPAKKKSAAQSTRDNFWNN